VFGLPTQALACARKLHRDLQQLGIHVRTGIHVGEIELRGDDVAGIAVNVAARVMGQAAGGDTLVTSVVRDLSAGSGFTFNDLPPTHLKGVDGEWTVCVVT
jgi:class 3 adenylate cyclase